MAESSNNSRLTLTSPPDFSMEKVTWPTVGVDSVGAASSAIAAQVALPIVGIYPSLDATRITLQSGRSWDPGTPGSWTT